MAQLSSADLQVGMKTARDVKDQQGRLLIPAGTSLTEKHLRAMKLWGIAVAHIEDEGGAGATGIKAAFSAEILDQAGTETERLFANNAANRDHPVFQPLFDHCLAKTARRIDTGGHDHAETKGSSQKPPEVEYKCDYSLGTIVRRSKTVSSLPAIYHEIVEVVNHPHSSAVDVANVISRDTGLTARLLKLVNSAFYGFPAKIETVSRATTMVGMNELCDLALATSVTGLFGKTPNADIDMSKFWSHSICCGLVGRSLANHRREPRTERYFVAGLLHDIGRLIIFTQLPATARSIMEESRKSGRPVLDLEVETMKFSHADVGSALLEFWNLAPSQQEAVECHHQPGAALRYPNEAAITHVAEITANAMRMGHSGDPLVPPLSVRAWDCLDLEPELLTTVMEETEMQVQDLTRILESDDIS
jgi:HD-like signal output (HDOD) protein